MYNLTGGWVFLCTQKRVCPLFLCTGHRVLGQGSNEACGLKLAFLNRLAIVGIYTNLFAGEGL